VLAPWWFGSAVLAGPICSLYVLLFPPIREGDTASRTRFSWFPRLLAASVPLIGTALCLALTFALNADRIAEIRQYREGNLTDVLLLGPLYTLRSLVDNLLLGFFGLYLITCPPWLVGVLLIALAAGVVVWWRLAPAPRLVLFGIAIILLNDVLAFGTRASVFSYPELAIWSRYQLYPQVGLALIVCAGLPRCGRLLTGQGTRDLTPAGRRVLLVLAALLFAIHLPRGQVCYYDPQQHADLRRVEDLDARCRGGSRCDWQPFLRYASSKPGMVPLLEPKALTSAPRRRRNCTKRLPSGGFFFGLKARCWPCLKPPPATMIGRLLLSWLLALPRLLPKSTIVRSSRVPPSSRVAFSFASNSANSCICWTSMMRSSASLAGSWP
jgi:hypothetical protein